MVRIQPDRFQDSIGESSCQEIRRSWRVIRLALAEATTLQQTGSRNHSRSRSLAEHGHDRKPRRGRQSYRPSHARRPGRNRRLFPPKRRTRKLPNDGKMISDCGESYKRTDRLVVKTSSNWIELTPGAKIATRQENRFNFGEHDQGYAIRAVYSSGVVVIERSDSERSRTG